MNIADLFRDLSYGELSNLSMADNGSGQILVKDQPRVLLAANEGLLNLHSRFVLSTNELWIEALSHITNYHLDTRFAESSYETSQEPYLYIKDLMGEPFTGDVIKVMEVFNDQECKLPLNDVEQASSVFTPQPKMLQIPNPVTGSLYSVVYQAKHDPLSIGDLAKEIVLPDVLHAALRGYIAYRIYSGMNTQEATVKAAEHLGNYESICNTALGYDLVNTSSSTMNTKFQRNGWI